MGILEKTDAGREALSSSTRVLTPRERTMVLLADGRRTLQDICGMVAGATPETLHSLHERGFLYIGPPPATEDAARARRRARQAAAAAASAAAQELESDVASGWSRSTLMGPDTQTPPTEVMSSRLMEDDTPVEPLAEAAPIEALARIRWARTPAATKLYLMDVVERTFASSDREHWERLRDLLREVRDEDSLAVAMELVASAVETVAGTERAQSLRQQLIL
jgi:hypothetical protein